MSGQFARLQCPKRVPPLRTCRRSGDFRHSPNRAAGFVHRSQSRTRRTLLIALVSTASMMPVKSLPSPIWETTLGLGFVSAVFDNIPLTALAIKQGNYDWGTGLCRRLRRLHDLVRIVRRRRGRGSDAGSEIRGPLAERGIARGPCLCCRVLPHACAAWLEP